MSIILFACKKSGCRDKEAINYDPGAEVSNTTCLFASSGVIFWNDFSHALLIEKEVTHLTCIFDHDTVFAHKDINTFIPKEDPICNDSELINFERLNYSNHFKVGVTLLDQDNDTIYASAIELLPYCESYELTIH